MSVEFQKCIEIMSSFIKPVDQAHLGPPPYSLCFCFSFNLSSLCILQCSWEILKSNLGVQSPQTKMYGAFKGKTPAERNEMIKVIA